MKCTILSVLGLLIVATAIFAQISPTPVINNEIRDGSSIRRRSMELERVKREADKPTFEEISKEQALKFALIKDDFEHIQTLQATIIKAYISDKKINYQKISDSAFEISRRAARLDVNLFIPKEERQNKGNKKVEVKPKGVKDLIVELDNDIGNFVSSPIFTNNKLVDSKASENSQIELEKIIKLSELLGQEAIKFK